MSNYPSLTIYFFSGTGNAKAASKWVASRAKEAGLDVEIRDMGKMAGMEIPAPHDGALLGFFYPTHGFNAPPVVLSFLRRFPKAKGNDVFFVNTRAGMKIHTLVTPGLSGIAQYLPALILALKGFRTVGWRPLDLPSNWISLHPALRGEAVEYIFESCQRTMEAFTRKVLSGKKALRGLLDLPFDLAISPIALLYYVYGRFALSKTFVSTSACDDCGRCQKGCPVNAIEKCAGRLFWRYDCESCMKCMNSCPKEAIQTAHGITFFLWWIVFSVLPAYGAGLLLENYAYPALGNTCLVNQGFEIAMAAVSMFSLFGAYRVIHILMKWRPFTFLVEWTSLTRLPFWGRYMVPKKGQHQK